MGRNQPHPLFSLLSQRQETAPIAPPAAVPEPHLADASGVADAAGDGGGGGAVHIGLAGPHVPHVALLGIQAPPSPDGRPGVTTFAPGIPAWLRREIVADVEWFDVRIRRRAKVADGDLAENPDDMPTEPVEFG